jgi:hypothetical protein
LLGKKVCTEHLKNGWKFHGKMSPQESIAFCKGYKAALGCGKKVIYHLFHIRFQHLFYL